jgi:hypothetical protein
MSRASLPTLFRRDWLRLSTASVMAYSLFGRLKTLAADQPNKKSKDDVVREITLKKERIRGKVSERILAPCNLDIRSLPSLSIFGINRAGELVKVLPEQNRIATQVDFAKERCLYFALMGSGEDKLSFKTEKGKVGPVIVFGYYPSFKDLKGGRSLQAHLYAIPKNATWRFEDKRFDDTK